MSSDIQIVSVIGANGQPLPIYGNSLGSNWSAPVKQERGDEAEIQELAAKMVESQKAALAKQQQQAAAQMANRQAVVSANGMQPPLTNANGQTHMYNYFTRQKLPNGTTISNVGPTYGGNGGSSSNSASANGNNSADKKGPCDEESQKGHFGWTTFGKTHIPYILRQQERYVSVRMIEMKLLAKYLNSLHPDIYSSCTCVRSYYITEAEARLLSDINHKHCDADYGRDLFTQKDLVVRLSDATKFYQFLDICYRKLVSGTKTPSERCGFIRINKESVVPYTVRNNEQVVPLFYFEGETENLKLKAGYLSGWDLAYLKFCCKVQGIRNELFSSENVAVISLTDIKSYFPNGTEFEDYWPSKFVDSNLLMGNRSNGNTSSVNWTRQPTQPPPKILSQSNLVQKATHAANAAAAQQQQQQQMLKRGASNTSSSFPQTAAAMAAAMQQTGQRMHNNATMATVQAALTNGLANGSWMSQQQNNLPLIHAQMLQAHQTHNNARAAAQYRNPMENLLIGNRQSPYTAYNNAAISMQPVNNHSQGNAPPPLVRTASGQNSNQMLNVEQTLLQQQQTLQQLKQQRFNPNSNSSSSSSLSPSSSSLPNITTISASSPTNNTILPGANPLVSANPYEFNMSSPSAAMPDFPSLALWNQLTATQRLLLTQQIKHKSSLLGSKEGLPPFPSLPLDTDLKTMLDYNPNKAKKPAAVSGSSLTCTVTSAAASNAQENFTKPTVPTVPFNSINPSHDNRQNHTSSTRCASTSSANYKTVPLNSSAALEKFEKRFKMTDEMKAVVQKVLSNPDLSTFIQTNSNQGPFISPPISPVIGGISSSSSSLSILPCPNVTITPQMSASFNHSPSSSSNPSPSSVGNSRLKSVICSTNSTGITLNVPLSPSTTVSTPSPSPTRAQQRSQHFQTINSHNYFQQQQHPQHHNQNATPLEVIDLSSPRRSIQAANAYIQQQQQQAAQQQAHQAAAVAAVQQQHRLAAAAQQHHSQQNGRSSNSSSSSNANSASMHLQRAAMANAAANNDRLHVIPEIAPPTTIQPYKVQKVYVENHMVPCINMKAYNDSEQLMTLTDFQKYFYHTVPLEQCKRLIEALGVELYKGNRRQIQILMETDRSYNENIPLVQVRDVIKFMPQLAFMIRNQDQQQPPSKRTRIS